METLAELAGDQRRRRIQALSDSSSKSIAALLRFTLSDPPTIDGWILNSLLTSVAASFALDELERAALAQPRSKPRPTSKEILKTVRDAFAAGLRHQRKSGDER